MRNVLPLICERLDKGVPLALATIVARKGSAPRGRGARLLADATGLVSGTVGGGAAEAAVLESCADALRTGGSRLFDLTLTNAMAAEEGMVCGGEVRVFVEVLLPSPELCNFFESVVSVLRGGEGIFLTRLVTDPESSPERILYTGDDVICFSGDGDADTLQTALRMCGPLAEPDVFSCNGKEYFADPLPRPHRMIIAGAGHVAVPTAELAAFAGFSVHIIDDRPEFSRTERFPKASSVTVAPEFADCLTPFSPDSHTCVVIVTRGHLCDGTVLAQALRTEAGYIGMIGSRKKRETVYASMREAGFGDAELKRVHCPIGMAIGAETPEEIAFSIVGECIAHKRGKVR